jgi:cell pole-organizing protein PopZ
MMGDMSREPSMEDILSSIRRVIARDETPGAKQESRAAVSDDVLDLHSEEVDESAEMQERESKDSDAKEPEAQAVEVKEMESVEADAVEIDEELLSPACASAARQSLDALNAALTPPPAPVETPAVSLSGRTVEEVVVDTLRPMLRDWLDANLPPLVEAMVAKEISRIVGQRR